MARPRTHAIRLTGLVLIAVGVALVLVAWPWHSSSMPPSAARVPLWQGRARFGVGAPGDSITRYPVDQLGIGWYLDWQVNAKPARPGGIEFAQMVRVKQGFVSPDAKTIA